MKFKQYLMIGLASMVPALANGAEPYLMERLIEYVRSNGVRIYDSARKVELRTFATRTGVIADLVIGENKSLLVLRRSSGKYLGDGLDGNPGKVDFVQDAPVNLLESLLAPISEPSEEDSSAFESMVNDLSKDAQEKGFLITTARQ